MAMNLTQKILSAHLLSGELIPGSEISIRIDQTLTQDSTGTMAYLQFEAMGVKRVKTKKSVAYIDHNTLQTGFENADDHYYIQTVTKKHGIYCSKPGNGICHQVQLERFGVPGYTLLGSDSHTPTGGGIGMLAIGAAWQAGLRRCGEGHYSGSPAPADRQGRRRQGDGVHRRRRENVECPGACDDYEHGRGTRRDDLHLPVG